MSRIDIEFRRRGEAAEELRQDEKAQRGQPRPLLRAHNGDRQQADDQAAQMRGERNRRDDFDDPHINDPGYDAEADQDYRETDDHGIGEKEAGGQEQIREVTDPQHLAGLPEL